MPVPPSRHLLRAKDLADARYAEELTVADLAAAARLSPAHFSREFRRVFGESPHQYLLTRRLERAASLLRTTDWSVPGSAWRWGYQRRLVHRQLRPMFGMPPTAYRAAYPPAAPGRPRAGVRGAGVRAPAGAHVSRRRRPAGAVDWVEPEHGRPPQRTTRENRGAPA